MPRNEEVEKGNYRAGETGVGFAGVLTLQGPCRRKNSSASLTVNFFRFIGYIYPPPLRNHSHGNYLSQSGARATRLRLSRPLQKIGNGRL